MALAQGLTVALGLLCRVASGAPAPGNADAGSTQSQIVLQPASHLAHDFEINRNSDGFVASRPPQQQQSRKLTGKFLHITDLHPDEFYRAHTSTEKGKACHRGSGPSGIYGAETSDCDSPFQLVNSTLDWIKANLKDDIDFVIWTGDSARHDSDEKEPRHNSEILKTNRIIADQFYDTFSDKHGLTIPVVPTFGNNDVYPHNILMPGPNDILRSYTDIWRKFIPEDQRHSFQFGGWFYVEVIPNNLAVFSLNTMYFFDRNAGIDDCMSTSEPGYRHFEWLRIQLQFMRERGMKAILIGHVPPARTAGKQLWDETCWQRYTLWLQQYRDVVISGLYGHMNVDHFMLQDTKQLDFSILGGGNMMPRTKRESMDDELTAQSSTDYLTDLREQWSQLPASSALSAESDELEETGKKKKKKKKKKKGKKGKNKLGGRWAERYQLTLVSPSIVPNYFPTLRVFEYNITGLENTPTWGDIQRSSNDHSPISAYVGVGDEVAAHEETVEALNSGLELRDDVSAEKNKKKKKKKKGKGKKGKKDPNLHVPKGPSKTTPPGPAYSPQPLTLIGYTQYFANLTYLNNDMAPSAVMGTNDDEDVSLAGWDPGKHSGKKPKHNKPKPHTFNFEVEYTTNDDKLYKLKDLTVRSFVDLATRIGQPTDSGKKKKKKKKKKSSNTKTEADSADVGTAESDADADVDKVEIEKKKKKKGKKFKNKTWLHFLQHAFVSTRSKKELEKDMA